MATQPWATDRSNTSLQSRLEMLLAKWPDVVIRANEHGYRVLLCDSAGIPWTRSKYHDDVAAAIRELTPDA